MEDVNMLREKEFQDGYESNQDTNRNVQTKK